MQLAASVFEQVRPRLKEEDRPGKGTKLPVKEALLSKNISPGLPAMTSLSAIRNPYTFLPVLPRSPGATI